MDSLTPSRSFDPVPAAGCATLEFPGRVTMKRRREDSEIDENTPRKRQKTLPDKLSITLPVSSPPKTPPPPIHPINLTFGTTERSSPTPPDDITTQERAQWRADIKSTIMRQELRFWSKKAVPTSSPLDAFLKLPNIEVLYETPRMGNESIWDVTMRMVDGFNSLLRLFETCWPQKGHFFRSVHQFLQFVHMLLGRQHSLTVAPTGSGKTLPVILFAQWLQQKRDSTQGHIILLIPYVLLYNQMQQVMEEAKVTFWKWDPNHRMGVGSLATVIAVSLEHSVRPEFWDDMSPLFQEMRIKGMVIDEAHAAVDDASFRSSFQLLAPRLGCLPVPLWPMTATCSPMYQQQLWSALGIHSPGDSAITTHARYIGQDIHFKIKYISGVTSDGSFQARCAKHINKNLSDAKTLVLTHRRSDVEIIADILGVSFIHGAMKRDDRTRILQEFEDTNRGKDALVANKACYYGMDVGCITKVIFVGLPDSLLSLQQAVGRAGRREQPVECEILLDNRKSGSLPPLPGTIVDFAGKSLMPLLLRKTCVDGLLAAFWNGCWESCERNAISGPRCTHNGFQPCNPEEWVAAPPPSIVFCPQPFWTTAAKPIAPPPLPTLKRHVIKQRDYWLSRNHNTHLWSITLISIANQIKTLDEPNQCLYCIYKGKNHTPHKWFKCFPADSKLMNYGFWDENVLPTAKEMPSGRVVYRAKDVWKKYYLPVFTLVQEDGAQVTRKCNDTLRPPLSAVCGKCYGPVWEEEFHEQMRDSYGKCKHEDLILEAIFFLWAENKPRDDFLAYMQIKEPKFKLHPDEPGGKSLAHWLWSESEVRGWCNAALWALPWIAHVYQDGVVGKRRYGVQGR